MTGWTDAELAELRRQAEDWEGELALATEWYALLDARLGCQRWPRLHFVLRLRRRWALREAEYANAAEARAWAVYNAAAAGAEAERRAGILGR